MDIPNYVKLDVTMATGRTRETVLANIARIDAIISSLMTTALTSVQTGNMIEYELDTGQTRTRVIYSKVAEVTSAIHEYEKLRQFYENMLTPKRVRLVDSKNFRGTC